MEKLLTNSTSVPIIRDLEILLVVGNRKGRIVNKKTGKTLLDVTGFERLDKPIKISNGTYDMEETGDIMFMHCGSKDYYVYANLGGYGRIKLIGPAKEKQEMNIVKA